MFLAGTRKILCRSAAALAFSVGVTFPAFAQNQCDCPPPPLRFPATVIVPNVITPQLNPPIGNPPINPMVDPLNPVPNPLAPMVDPLNPGNPALNPVTPPLTAVPLNADDTAAQNNSPFAQPTEAGTQPSMSFAPNMLGDTAGGSCGGLNFGGLLRVRIEHPTFGCSRLNISENNSPLVRDRVYIRYNLFKGQSETDIFSDSPNGARSVVDLERYTFGFEKTYLNGRASIEFRMPINNQLTSDINLSDFQGTTNLPLVDRSIVFGNLSVLNKFMLYRSSSFNLSTGFGINIPTEQPVRIRANIDNDNFLLAGVGSTLPPGFTGQVDATFQGVIDNSTVNLSPFMGFVYTPNDRFFAQGFWQIDVPLNGSNAEVSGSSTVRLGPIGPFNLDLPGVDDPLIQQTLMRFDLGLGYFVYKNPDARWIRGVAPTIEAHYSTTLQDAELLTQRLDFFPGSSADLTVGNWANRVDVFNLTLGNTLLIGDRSTLATGLVIPLSTGDNKPFDYEFTLQFNWRFGPQS